MIPSCDMIWNCGLISAVRFSGKKWRQELETYESGYLLLSVGLSKSPP